MPPGEPIVATQHRPRRRAGRVLLLLAGLLLPQVLVYWPSLIGERVLLPLDVLAEEGVYLPRGTPVIPHNPVLADPVYQIGPPFLEFMRREFASGRIPAWIPDIYCGAPFASSGKFCVFSLIYYLWPVPQAFVWMHLARVMVAGLGAYLFFRRAMSVGFWAAAIGAWCYPWTAFFVFWQGYGLTQVAAWFPWLLAAVETVVRRPHVRGWGAPALAAITFLACNGGQLDVAGLVLIASGLYAAWRLGHIWLTGVGFGRAARAGGILLAAWSVGLLMSAPAIVPLVDYCRFGARFISRGAGAEDRPPEGLAAWPQIVLPYVYGSSQRGSTRIGSTNILESAAAGYAGLVAALLAAPLAWWSRQRLSMNLCWLVLAMLSFSWVAAVPGVVDVLRLKGLNWFSWNRLVVLGAFSILALAVTGLDLLLSADRRPPAGRSWGLVFAAVVLLMGTWCASRALRLPESLTQRIASDVPERSARWRMQPDEAERLIHATYRRYYFYGAALCAVAVAGWALFISGRAGAGTAIVIGLLMCAELVVYGHDFNPQCDRSLYYPPLPALEAIRRSGRPGRILGVECLPPNLNLMWGLADARGYDGTDPRLIVEVMEPARLPGSMCYPFARTLIFVPRMHFEGGKAVVHPVLSMLGVRYIVLRRPPPAGVEAFYDDGDYVVLENERALPRVYVPRTVRTVADEQQALERTSRWDFDPAEAAYVHRAVDAAPVVRGQARIEAETPCRITIAAKMESPGLMVLADQWHPGWRARVDGRPAEVLRVNYALRGIALSAGEHTVVMEYKPGVLAASLAAAVAGACVLAVWSIMLLLRRGGAATRPAVGGAES